MSTNSVLTATQRVATATQRVATAAQRQMLKPSEDLPKLWEDFPQIVSERIYDFYQKMRFFPEFPQEDLELLKVLAPLIKTTIVDVYNNNFHQVIKSYSCEKLIEIYDLSCKYHVFPTTSIITSVREKIINKIPITVDEKDELIDAVEDILYIVIKKPLKYTGTILILVDGEPTELYCDGLCLDLNQDLDRSSLFLPSQKIQQSLIMHNSKQNPITAYTIFSKAKAFDLMGCGRFADVEIGERMGEYTVLEVHVDS